MPHPVDKCKKKTCDIRKKTYICTFGTKCTILQMVLNDSLFH